MILQESDKEDNVENVDVKSDDNPLETKKGNELLGDKNDENVHEVTESRVERSSEGASDHVTANADIKTAIDNQEVDGNLDENTRRSSSDDVNRKSSEKTELNTDDVDSERISNINDDEFDEYSIDDMEKSGNDGEVIDKIGADKDEIQGKAIDDNSPVDSSRVGSHEAQDTILDQKARTSQKFDDVEPAVDSSFEVNDNIKLLGW